MIMRRDGRGVLGLYTESAFSCFWRDASRPVWIGGRWWLDRYCVSRLINVLEEAYAENPEEHRQKRARLNPDITQDQLQSCLAKRREKVNAGSRRDLHVEFAKQKGECRISAGPPC